MLEIVPRDLVPGKLPRDPVLGKCLEIQCWKNYPEIQCWENYPEIQDIIQDIIRTCTNQGNLLRLFGKSKTVSHVDYMTVLVNTAVKNLMNFQIIVYIEQDKF